MVRRAFPVLVFGLIASCTDNRVDDPVLSWRRRLADPAAYAVRDGLAISAESLYGLQIQFREQHRDFIAHRWDVWLQALPEGPAPETPTYRLVVEFPADPKDRTPEALTSVFERDVSAILRRNLRDRFRTVASQTLKMDPSDVQAWLAFVSLAEPAVSRCEAHSLCMSYGDLDVFVFSLIPYDGMEIVDGIRWMQRVGP